MNKLAVLFAVFVSLASCQKKEYSIIIRNGTVYDGSGAPSVVTDIGIQGDTIAFIGDLSGAVGKKEIDAKGLAVTPGFINMLSWSVESLLEDGRSLGEIKQGVTLQVMGEGESMGPMNDAMKAEYLSYMDDSLKKKFDNTVPWTTLGEYLEYVEKSGTSQNIASFIGATTPRVYVIGSENRAATPEEMEKMKSLVKQAMEEGAMGVASSLIYAPAAYASTEEVIELCKVASEYHGMYITHMRSEANKIYEALNETFRIAREANLPAEIYHLKISQKENWSKVDSVINMIAAAQKEGLKITADMYTYIAGGTGLTALVPTSVQSGGLEEMIKRFKDKKIKTKVIADMRNGLAEMHNDPTDVLIVDFKKDSLDQLYKARRLSEIAKLHGKSPEETTLDLLAADHSRIETIYFMMSEENVKRQLQLPYVSLGSDAASTPAEGRFLLRGDHPRAKGNFARFLGKYVRDEKIMSLEEAVRRMTSLPASNLKIVDRGAIKVGYFADFAIFDPVRIKDHATFEAPHQYATGMSHVIVNGTLVLENGEHTGAMPGRVVRGPGWTGKR
jgi:N-acyl-D-amino-acid deacylase